MSFYSYGKPLQGSRLPEDFGKYYGSSPDEKFIFIHQSFHKWGAYDEKGKLIRSGIASTGKNWCDDLRKSCRTPSGSFRMFYKDQKEFGDEHCINKPYCMYFSATYAFYGAGDKDVGAAYLSRGNIRLHMEDAEWLSKDFAKIGTRVLINHY